MSDHVNVKKSTIRLEKGDITDLQIQSFVYYAQENLQLGSGYGTAISVRGGPSVQDELNKIGKIKTTETVISGAGEMKADFIIHANGPKFQEPDIESKLKQTVINCLKLADEKKLKAVAFPAMGAGFYGIPLDVCARVLISTINEYMSGDTQIDDVVICLLDNREYKPFAEYLASTGQGL